MPNDASNTGFQSVLAPFIDRFLQEKHTCGYAYHEPIRILHRFDEFLVREGLATLELPRSIVRNWLAKKPHESAATQQQRITIVRQFTKFLLQTGYPAYVPDSTLGVRKSTFVPRMLTDEELRKIFHAVDTLEPTARSPLRHLVMPEVFRLLYGCGFRVNEVLKSPQSSRTVRQASFPERTPPTPVTFRSSLHSSKVSRQSTTQTSYPQPRRKSAYA